MPQCIIFFLSFLLRKEDKDYYMDTYLDGFYIHLFYCLLPRSWCYSRLPMAWQLKADKGLLSANLWKLKSHHPLFFFFFVKKNLGYWYGVPIPTVIQCKVRKFIMFQWFVIFQLSYPWSIEWTITKEILVLTKIVLCIYLSLYSAGLMTVTILCYHDKYKHINEYFCWSTRLNRFMTV